MSKRRTWKKIKGTFAVRVDVDALADQIAEALAGRLAPPSAVYERNGDAPAAPAAGFQVGKDVDPADLPGGVR